MSQEKVKKLYNYVSKEILNYKQDLPRHNSAVLFSFLSALTNSSALIIGEPGTGKTTLAQFLASAFTKTNYIEVENATLKGSPEITLEYIIGRPHLGELNQGNEKVIWSSFVAANYKIIDEINRIPEFKQNILLSGLNSNNWNYLNETYTAQSGPIYATANQDDAGNFSIIPPLLDRFDVCVELKSPGLNNLKMLNKNDILSRYKELSSDGIKNFLWAENNFSKEDVVKEIMAVKFSLEAELFSDYLISETSSCYQFGEKRSNQLCPEGCHYSSYACNKTKGALTIRSSRALEKFSKAYAYLSGKDVVETDDVMTVFPFISWHKLSPKRDFLASIIDAKREDTLDLHALKLLTVDMRKRADKTFSKQASLLKKLATGHFKEAIDMAEKLDHPVFKNYLGG